MQQECPVNGERHSVIAVGWGWGQLSWGLRLLISPGWSGVAQPWAVGLALGRTFSPCRDRCRVMITGAQQ